MYLTDLADFSAVNAVHTESFVEPYPARTTIVAAGLPRGVAVEIELKQHSTHLTRKAASHEVTGEVPQESISAVDSNIKHGAASPGPVIASTVRARPDFIRSHRPRVRWFHE